MGVYTQKGVDFNVAKSLLLGGGKVNYLITGLNFNYAKQVEVYDCNTIGVVRAARRF
jgi:hypothetical protein